jgi:uncharacterized protein (TIGR00369 family)
MAVRSLTNARWGFESSCFVCEESNDGGLRIPFEHDEEAEVVRAAFRLDARFSGAPSYLHGGVSLAVLDEAMAWAAIAIGGKWAVTAETSARFSHPVRVDRDYRVEARVDELDAEAMRCSATILDAEDRPCATASATFVVLSAAQALDATGTEATGDAAGFTR